MSWRIRHEGSPQSIDNLTLEQVVEGLQDGHWEATDEVMGPQDTGWVAVENHPLFAEIAEDLVPPPAKPYDDETRLDMTALIDVTLVLLIFFILTTTYATLQKIMELPDVATDQVGPRVLTDKEVLETMVHVKVKQEDGKPVIRIENEVVTGDLITALRRYSAPKKLTRLLIEHDPEVPHGTIVALQDAAKGARMERVLILVPKNELVP
jgi:biopolymer transport protein ExbD